MNETLQRIAIACGLGLVMFAAGVDILDGTPWFWCALALFWASNWLEWRGGFEVGVAQGIEMMTDMSEQQRTEVMALVKEAQKEDNE